MKLTYKSSDLRVKGRFIIYKYLYMEFKRNDQPPREMIQGEWECADCKEKITELPFKPSPDRPIYCRECWRKRRR